MMLLCGEGVVWGRVMEDNLQLLASCFLLLL